MKMKKIVALFLSAAMVASMAVGCGSKDDGKKDASSDGKTVLKFAAFEGGNGTEIWEKIADAFEKSHENVEVELEMSSELDKDLTKDFQNGDIPGRCILQLRTTKWFHRDNVKRECNRRSF